MNDQQGRPIVVLPETLKRATRIYETGSGTTGWEEIDYAETNFFVHSAEDFNLEIVFVLDFTNSMAQARLSDGRSGVKAMMDAFEEALSGLLGAQRVGVVEFHDRSVEPQVLSALTSDRSAVLEKARAFAASPYEPGSSIVWDSIQTAAGLFTSREEGPDVVRALIFISDGRDTSSVSVRDAAGVTATTGEIQLYALGVGEVFEGEQLEAMVRSTGGVYYPTRELDALQEQLGALVRDLRGQFRVSYVTLRRNGVFNPESTEGHRWTA